jgi:hypothetical protein
MDYYENHRILNARCHHSPLINIPLTESSTFLVRASSLKVIIGITVIDFIILI